MTGFVVRDSVSLRHLSSDRTSTTKGGRGAGGGGGGGGHPPPHRSPLKQHHPPEHNPPRRQFHARAGSAARVLSMMRVSVKSADAGGGGGGAGGPGGGGGGGGGSVSNKASDSTAGRKQKIQPAHSRPLSSTPVVIGHSKGPCTNFSATNLTAASTLNWTRPNHGHLPPPHKTPTPCLGYLPCDWTPQSLFRPIRFRASIHCDRTTRISFSRVKGDVTPALVSIRDKACLKRVIQGHCLQKGQKVPKVAHYVQFGAFNMTFTAFLGVVSAARFFGPCLILFHGDAAPRGPYWRALLHLLPNVLHVPLNRPRDAHGHVIRQAELSPGEIGAKAVLDYGGAYLDTDYLMLRPVDHLLHKPTTMGNTSSPNRLGKTFFLGTAGAPFLRLWLSRNNTHPTMASQHSDTPSRLASEVPHLLHVVGTFFAPGCHQVEPLYGKKTSRFNWTRSHGIHLCVRELRKKLAGRPRLDKLWGVVGDMARSVLYGHPSACLRADKGGKAGM
ncbi:uncharacterized protein LOC143291761 isoform X2 [Babylonia areolata]